jgi:hypothetical protein
LNDDCPSFMIEIVHHISESIIFFSNQILNWNLNNTSIDQKKCVLCVVW